MKGLKKLALATACSASIECGGILSAVVSASLEKDVLTGSCISFTLDIILIHNLAKKITTRLREHRFNFIY